MTTAPAPVSVDLCSALLKLVCTTSVRPRVLIGADHKACSAWVDTYAKHPLYNELKQALAKALAEPAVAPSADAKTAPAAPAPALALVAAAAAAPQAPAAPVAPTALPDAAAAGKSQVPVEALSKTQQKKAKKAAAAAAKPVAPPAPAAPAAPAAPVAPKKASPPNFWAAGTGYGHGGQSDWDPETWAAAKAKVQGEIQSALETVTKELTTAIAGLKGDAALKAQALVPVTSAIEQSALLPVVELQLQNNSITEMERMAALYGPVFGVLELFAATHGCEGLLTAPIDGAKGKTLNAYIAELSVTAAAFEKRNIDLELKATKLAAKAAAAAGTPAAAAPAAPAAPAAAAAAPTIPQRIVALAVKALGAVGQLPTPTPGNPAPGLSLVSLVRAKSAEKQKADGAPAAAAAAPTATAAPAAAVAAAPATPGKSDAKSAPADEKQSKAAADKLADAKANDEYCAALRSHQFNLEVENFNSHKFASYGDGKPAPAWGRRLAAEFTDLSASLPLHADSSVFMAIHESKMGLAQMLITAPPDTPYAGGAFVFDVAFDSNYPAGPPKVNLQTTGGGAHRFNPNLYNCGKVCLSILGTWSGQKGESWNAKSSTFLQVAVSIQSLVFVPQPYFNEPGYESSMGTDHGQKQALAYDHDQQQATVRYAMIGQLQNPPKNWEHIIRTHFRLRKDKILATVEGWAKDNPKVKEQLETLKAELAKLSPATAPAPAPSSPPMAAAPAKVGA